MGASLVAGTGENTLPPGGPGSVSRIVERKIDGVTQQSGSFTSIRSVVKRSRRSCTTHVRISEGLVIVLLVTDSPLKKRDVF